MDIAIIPAYNPNMKLVELAAKLRERGIEHIIVVNDGSEEQTGEVFRKLRDDAIVLTHSVNMGKGAAIKTALKYIQNNLNGIQGIVIVDADGQHRPEDAMRLLAATHENHSGMVLGVRSFTGKIPFRSLFGNTVTKYVFRLFSGKWISDTQTGLRAFPVNMAPELLKIKGERYEYEMNVLLACAKKKTQITEIPINTIYLDKHNSNSHFRTVVDSARIYGNIIAFSGASFLSFLLDYALFIPFVGLFGMFLREGTALIAGNIMARIFSASFNYYLNSTFVFRWREDRIKSICQYSLLALFVLALNTTILYCLHKFFGLTKIPAKLITEMILFILSYTVQKFWIFKKRRQV